MKKRRKGRTLSRVKEQRVALLRTLSVSLIKHKRIKTTLAKAKELRPFVEKLLTKAKGLADKDRKFVIVRELKKDLGEASIHELARIAQAADTRKGGYTRIVKLGLRRSDAAEMALIEWVDQVKEEVAEAKKEEKAVKKVSKKVSKKVDGAQDKDKAEKKAAKPSKKE